MRVFDGLCQGDQDLDRDFNRNRFCSCGQPGGERRTGTKFLSDIAARPEIARFKHRHDIRMMQPGRRFSLLGQPLAQLRRQDDFRPWKLHGDLPVKQPVAGLKHDSMRASAEFSSNLEAANLKRRIRGNSGCPRKRGEGLDNPGGFAVCFFLAADLVDELEAAAQPVELGARLGRKAASRAVVAETERRSALERLVEFDQASSELFRFKRVVRWRPVQ